MYSVILSRYCDIFFSGDAEYEFIKMNSKTMLLCKGYTYSKSGHQTQKYYRCSKRNSRSCMARINFDSEWQIKSADLNHNHPPPKIHKLENGTYIKIDV